MKRTAVIISLLISTFFISSLSPAIETAPRITDSEIVESLAEIRGDIKRLKEGQKAILREIDNRFEAVDSQFNRLSAIFTALVVAIIGFAIWDRRTMIRPFEAKAKEIEEEIADNRTKLHSLLDALRTLSKSDEKVAEVLRRFNLL